MAFERFRTAFGWLLAIGDGFSLSWTAFSYRERRFAPPIPVFFFIFFFGPKGQKKKSMKHNWRMVDKRGVRSSRRRFDHPAGVRNHPKRREVSDFVFVIVCVSSLERCLPLEDGSDRCESWPKRVPDAS